MRKVRLAAFLILLTGAALPAAAEGQIIYFSNGTTMEAKSVEYTEGMIHVFLDEDAKLAFPRYLVERVEESDAPTVGIRGRGSRGRKSTRSTSSSANSGRVAPQPATNRPAGSAATQGKVEANDNGLITERPFAGSNHPGKRQLRLTGSEAARSGARAGGRPMNGRAGAGAGRTVLPSHRGRQREAQQGPEIKSFEFDPKSRADKPKPPANNSGDSQQNNSDQGGSDN